MITNTHSFNFKTEAREGQNEKILPQALVARIPPSEGAFTFNSHHCLTYIKQHMTAKSVHIKD